MTFAEAEIQQALHALEAGELVAFRTDFGSCVGCDATQSKAVIHLRQQCGFGAETLLPVLLADERDVLQWVATADLAVFDVAAEQEPTTAIRFENGLGMADEAMAADGSVLILLTRDPLSRHLVKRLRKPILVAPVPPATAAELTPVMVGMPGHNGECLMQQSLKIMSWRKGVPVVRKWHPA